MVFVSLAEDVEEQVGFFTVKWLITELVIERREAPLTNLESQSLRNLRSG